MTNKRSAYKQPFTASGCAPSVPARSRNHCISPDVILSRGSLGGTAMSSSFGWCLPSKVFIYARKIDRYLQQER